MVSNGKLLGGETKENLCVSFSHASHWHPKQHLAYRPTYYIQQHIKLNILCQQYVLHIQSASSTVEKWSHSVEVHKALVERSHYVAILQKK